MELKDYKSKMSSFFAHCEGQSIDICAELYIMILDAPDEYQKLLFAQACTEFGITESDDSVSVNEYGLTDQDIDRLKKKHGSLVNSLLNSVIKQARRDGLDEMSVHENIWDNVICNPLFISEEDHIFAVYYVLIDAQIPYIMLEPGLEMSSSDYKLLIDECWDDISKVKYILRANFDQKTQRSSNLVDVILKQDSYEKQVVIMSRLVEEARSERKLFSSAIKKLLSSDPIKKLLSSD